MNKVMKAVDIELTQEECQILHDAEKILEQMFNEVNSMEALLYDSDRSLIGTCLARFHEVTARYNVHVTLGVDQTQGG